jgi:hypothetical protein
VGRCAAPRRASKSAIPARIAAAAAGSRLSEPQVRRSRADSDFQIVHADSDAACRFTRHGCAIQTNRPVQVMCDGAPGSCRIPPPGRARPRRRALMRPSADSIPTAIPCSTRPPSRALPCSPPPPFTHLALPLPRSPLPPPPPPPPFTPPSHRTVAQPHHRHCGPRLSWRVAVASDSRREVRSPRTRCDSTPSAGARACSSPSPRTVAPWAWWKRAHSAPSEPVSRRRPSRRPPDRHHLQLLCPPHPACPTRCCQPGPARIAHVSQTAPTCPCSPPQLARPAGRPASETAASGPGRSGPAALGPLGSGPKWPASPRQPRCPPAL